MNNPIPTGKFQRTLSSGKIAARMGRNQVGFWLKKSLTPEAERTAARRKLDQDNARVLFQGLALLKGTALKAAQMLSFETELFPEAFRKELEKSYHQVPPINRALIRKILRNNLGASPEDLFSSFDSEAFAAASLGQVHLAASKQGDRLAVKVQYPDVAQTISNDIRLLKTLCYPLAEYEIIKIALDEIETVLLAETDYGREADNIRFFRENLSHPRVRIPDLFPDLSSRQVLTMTRMDGLVLSQWLATRPDQAQRTRVAQTLHDIFIQGFYEIKCIHADPNPGNFLVAEDGTVSLLDFGCVRRFDDRFIRLYKRLVRLGGSRNRDDFQELLTDMHLITPDLAPGISRQMADLFMDVGDWYGQLFQDDRFDFGANPDFMEKGRKIGQQMHRFRKHIHRINPEFVFLDRTRYGLIRLFETMKVRIRMRNQYEYTDHS